MNRLLRLAGLAGTLVLGVSCREPKVTSYRVPAEPDPVFPGATSAPDAMAAGAVPAATGPDLKWTAPDHWQAQAPSTVRKGSYLVPGTPPAGNGDMSITAFPGDVGGQLANLNRWRGQIELPPLTEAEAAPTISHVDANGLHFDVVDFANTRLAQPQRVLGAIVPFNGTTWFFKLSGPDDLIAREKPNFLRLLDSVRTP